MADTLEEIYKATLSASDFDSSGVKTIFTTDANTSYVLKDVQVQSSLATIPIQSNLLINDVTVANLDSAVSGSEIVAPSSTVKIDASTYPLAYTDKYYSVFSAGAQMMRSTSSFVAGVADTSLVGVNTITAPYGTITNYTYVGYWEGVGANNVAIQINNDDNSESRVYVYNSSGTQVFTDTTTYSPKAFDGERYIYWLPNGANMKRYDTLLNQTDDIALPQGSGNPSTYPRLMYAGKGYFLGWKEYGNAQNWASPFVYNANTGKIYLLGNTGQNASTMFGAGSTNIQAVYDETSGNILVCRVSSSSEFRPYAIQVSDGALPTYQGSKSMSGFTTWHGSGTQWMSSGDDAKLYFYSNGGKVAYYDVVSQLFTETSLQFSSSSPLGGRGHLTIGTLVPSASTVSGRTYTINPQVTYRVTGIKSV